MPDKILRVFVRFSGLVGVSLAFLLVSTASATSTPAVTVNCNNGQSLNGTLATLNKQTPHTVIVQGTCTEFVTVDGFEGLTLIGQSGATIQQPATNPQNNSYVLSVTGARGLVVSGLTVNSLSSILSGIGIGKGSSQVQLQNMNITGSWGVFVYEESQVWLVHVNVTISSGYAAIAAYDKSDVHIVGGLLQRPSDGGFYAGVAVGSGHVTMQGTTIRDMQQGINIGESGSVDLVDFDANEPVDVTIGNPSGTNQNGAIVSDGSSLNVATRLIIKNAGQTYGGNSGAVFVTNNSTLNAGANLIVSNSQGQGVIVTNNSHATLGGSSIINSLHGGLVAANLSTIDIQSFTSLTVVGGNKPDLFCDANSFITGTANLSGVPTATCANQLTGNTVTLP